MFRQAATLNPELPWGQGHTQDFWLMSAINMLPHPSYRPTSASPHPNIHQTSVDDGTRAHASSFSVVTAIRALCNRRLCFVICNIVFPAGRLLYHRLSKLDAANSIYSGTQLKPHNRNPLSCEIAQHGYIPTLPGQGMYVTQTPPSSQIQPAAQP